MNRIAIATSLALVFAAPAFAQDVPEAAPTNANTTMSTDDALPATTDVTPVETRAITGHVVRKTAATVYTGPRSYPMFTTSGARSGEPRVVDHRMDSAIVEPTSTTVDVAASTPMPTRQ